MATIGYLGRYLGRHGGIVAIGEREAPRNALLFMGTVTVTKYLLRRETGQILDHFFYLVCAQVAQRVKGFFLNFSSPIKFGFKKGV